MNRYDGLMRSILATPSGLMLGEGPIHLSEDDLVAAEQRLGASLPADYREFIRDFGRFSIPLGSFYIPSRGRNFSTGIEIFSKIDSRPGSRDLLSFYNQVLESWDDWPEDYLPIATDAGTGMVLLAFKGQNVGSVCFLADQRELVFVASSFDEFLHLIFNDEYEPEAVEEAEAFWKAYLGEE